MTGKSEPEQKTGANAFSPELDRFLKEHLFADIFDRDVLSYAERETATIAALATLGGVEPQLESHLNIGMNVDLSKADLMQIIDIVDANVGAGKAEKGRDVLNKIPEKPTTMEIHQTNQDEDRIFPKTCNR